MLVGAFLVVEFGSITEFFTAIAEQALVLIERVRCVSEWKQSIRPFSVCEWKLFCKNK